MSGRINSVSFVIQINGVNKYRPLAAGFIQFLAEQFDMVGWGKNLSYIVIEISCGRHNKYWNGQIINNWTCRSKRVSLSLFPRDFGHVSRVRQEHLIRG